MRKRGTLKAAIVKALTDCGPLTAAQIANHAGLPAQPVRVAINAMLTRFGGAVRMGKSGRDMVYGLPGHVDHQARKALRENVAGPRYVADMGSVLRRDPFEHQRLAMAGR